MYSWEIQKLIELKNYLIEVEDYLKICSTSPQIREIKYNSYDDNFYIKTDDNLKIYFKVKKKEG